MSSPRRDVAPSCQSQNEQPLLGSRVPRGSQSVIFLSPSIARSICLCRETMERAVQQTSDKVLEPHGFCVCNTAQHVLGLGKRAHVLYNTPNKINALCDPHDTFAFERLQRSLLFLEVTHGVCQISNTSTIRLLPSASKVGLDGCLRGIFRSDSSSSMYALYDSSFTQRHCFAASSTTSTLH